MRKYNLQKYYTNKLYIIAGVGLGTFFFGFFAGAVASAYLMSIHAALVTGLRTSLQFKSAIFGDGFILPVTNMVAAAFLISKSKFISRTLLRKSLLLGLAITIYFHLNQAINHLVNWAMPTPWHWNVLGLWHAIYMFSVCSFLSCFYLTSFRFIKAEKKIPYHVWTVTAGLILFFLLLRLDYVSVTLGNLMLR